MDINKYNPKRKLNNNHLLSLENYSEEEIYEILHLTRDIVMRSKAGEKLPFLKNKNILLLTKKSFTRSKIAFEIAVNMLTGNPIVSSLSGSEVESIIADRDSVKAITSYGIDGIMVLTSNFKDAESIEKYVSIPIINANAESGPCEVLATLYTIWQKKNALANLKLAVIGDMNAHSSMLLYGAIKCGMDVSVISSSDRQPDDSILDYCGQYGDISNYDVMSEGLKNADVVYVYNDDLGDKYYLNKMAMSFAKPNAIILHTLPLNRNVDIDEDLINSPNSAIYEQAENLLNIDKAVLSLLIK